jgi:hypothetical protein
MHLDMNLTLQVQLKRFIFCKVRQGHAASAMLTMYSAAWSMRGGLGGRICHTYKHDANFATETVHGCPDHGC